MQKLSLSSGRRLLKKWWLDFRRSLAHAPRLDAVYPSFIAWTWNYSNPAGWNVYQSFDDGVTFQIEEASFTATERSYAPADGSLPTFIVGVDENGNEVTRRSRIVVPSDWGVLNAYTLDWLSRIALSFGVEPANETIIAVNSFGNALIVAGIDTKMIAVNPVVPDNLTAALTPLIKTHGYDTWNNMDFGSGEFTSSELSVDGLDNPNLAYLDTGIIPSDCLVAGSGGISMYVSSDVPGAYAESGAHGGDDYLFILYPEHGGTAYLDIFSYPTGRVNGTSLMAMGYASGNRTTTSASAIYHANSVIGHQTVVSGGDTDIGEPPGYSVHFYTFNYFGDPWGNPSPRRYSFFAIHEGLTEAESTALYEAVQQLRTTLGGGYV